MLSADSTSLAKIPEEGTQAPLVLSGYHWDHYLSLDALFQDSNVRVRFLDKHLQIMPPISETHEKRKVQLSRLIDSWCMDCDLDFVGTGSTTLKVEGEAGGEPDESYFIGEEKSRPDLVIEIALTSGGLSKRAFYAKFGIPEIWIWRNEKLEVHVFDESKGQYNQVTESKVLPGINLNALEKCATILKTSEAIREFRRLTRQ